MRQLWRLIRGAITMVGHAAYLWATVHRRPPEARDLYRAEIQRRASRSLCRILRLEIVVEGTQPEGGAMLAVSNHISAFDPFIIAGLLPASIVGKAELRRMPVIGWVCAVAGLIFVERSRRMEANQFVETLQTKLRHGVRVLVFPEGTTSNGSGIMRFKTGSFEAVANMADGAVLPLCVRVVSVNGTPLDQLRPPHFIWDPAIDQSMFAHFWTVCGLRKAKIILRIGEPIPTAGQDRKALTTASQAAVEALFAATPTASTAA